MFLLSLFPLFPFVSAFFCVVFSASFSLSFSCHLHVRFSPVLFVLSVFRLSAQFLLVLCAMSLFFPLRHFRVFCAFPLHAIVGFVGSGRTRHRGGEKLHFASEIYVILGRWAATVGFRTGRPVKTIGYRHTGSTSHPAMIDRFRSQRPPPNGDGVHGGQAYSFTFLVFLRRLARSFY